VGVTLELERIALERRVRPIEEVRRLGLVMPLLVSRDLTTFALSMNSRISSRVRDGGATATACAAALTGTNKAIRRRITIGV